MTRDTMADLSIIPLNLLQAELQRRQDGEEKPACGSVRKGSYNTGAHVFALFLILILSTLGKTNSKSTGRRD